MGAGAARVTAAVVIMPIDTTAAVTAAYTSALHLRPPMDGGRCDCEARAFGGLTKGGQCTMWGPERQPQ